jgi:sulfur-oxidizing protein SoxX
VAARIDGKYVGRLALAGCVALVALAIARPAAADPGYAVSGDGIAAPLAGAAAGDAVRGRALVANRQASLCLLCHTGPIPEERFQGNLAPDLHGAGQRWSAAQLRLRIVDASHFNPLTIMPSYYKTDGLNRVAPAFRDKTILTAQQIEDVVAWLLTLKEQTP